MAEELGYNEEQAVKFIRNYVPREMQDKYTDDEILIIVDIIWDYYEQKGMLSLNDIETEEELLNEDDLIAYVKKEVKAQNDFLVDPNDIPYVVKGELQYEESLEDVL